MSTLKHTPAPWKVRYFRTENPEYGFFVEAKNNNIPELGYGIEIMMDDFGDHNGYPFEQRLADAKLIAAAPELLQVCIELQKWNDKYLPNKVYSYDRVKAIETSLTEIVNKALEAIKKATE